MSLREATDSLDLRKRTLLRRANSPSSTSIPSLKEQALAGRGMSANHFLRQSLSDMTPLNTSSAPSSSSGFYIGSAVLEVIGFLSIIYITSSYVDIHTGPGRSLMIAVVLCCFIIGVLDYYFSVKTTLSQTEHIIDTVIWPSLFSFLYILAGVSLETGFGLFNELYIMLFCLVVTLTAFMVALRKNSMSLSVIALLAGIAMPFIIEDAYETSISVLYSFLIISSALGLYLYHGWALLLVAASLGFWGTMHVHNLLALSRRDTEMIRAIIFIQWISFWLATTIRERFLSKTNKSNDTRRIQQRKLIWFNLFILLGCTHLLASTYYNIAYWAAWGISKGILYFFASLCFALWEKKNPPPDGVMSLFYPNYVVSVFLLTVGLWLGTHGEQKLLSLCAEATIIIFVSYYTKDIIGMIAGGALQLYIIAWSCYILIFTEPSFAVLNREGLIQLTVVAMFASQAHFIQTFGLKLIYEGIVHSMFNMWLYREFAYSENYLYFVTALYPASVQMYAYFKGDSAPVTIIRMIFGDVLWLWLFISQTLPRLLLLEGVDSWFPFGSLVGALDIFVICLGFQSSLLQDCRLQGTTRWIYLAFGNATWISLIYREANPFDLVIPYLAFYLVALLIAGLYSKSNHLILGAILTFFVLVIDDYIHPNNDILWKGTLALFAGILAIAVIIVPKNYKKIRENIDPIEERAKILSKSGNFDLSKMSFNIPASQPRTLSALRKSQASQSLHEFSSLRSRSLNNVSRTKAKQ